MINKKLMDLVLEAGAETLARNIQVKVGSKRAAEITETEALEIVKANFHDFQKEAAQNYALIASGAV